MNIKVQIYGLHFHLPNSVDVAASNIFFTAKYAKKTQGMQNEIACFQTIAFFAKTLCVLCGKIGRRL